MTYLGLKLTAEQLQEIYDKYQPKQPALDGTRTHFSKGVAHRYQTEFSPNEQNFLAEKYEPYLRIMGYPV